MSAFDRVFMGVLAAGVAALALFVRRSRRERIRRTEEPLAELARTHLGSRWFAVVARSDGLRSGSAFLGVHALLLSTPLVAVAWDALAGRRDRAPLLAVLGRKGLSRLGDPEGR